MNKLHESVIALVGFMGSGKTTIGRILAERLGLDFVDLDSRIEELSGMKIPDYFRCFGEAAFRKIETETFKSETKSGRAIVLACGGGIVENPENRDIMARHCRTVWLDVPEKELVRRLKENFAGRPMLAGDLEARIRMLFERRYNLYSSVASIRHSWREGETSLATIDALMALLGAKADRNPQDTGQ